MALDYIEIADAATVARKVGTDVYDTDKHAQINKVAFGAVDVAPTLVSGADPLPVAPTFGAGTLDTFGHVIAGAVHNQVDVQFFRDTPQNLVTVSAPGSSSAISSLGGALFQTGADTTVTVSGTTTATTRYCSGAEVYCLVAGGFTAGIASSHQRLGLFDANNGFFLGYQGTTFGVTVRNNAADAFVSAFSDDPLDASAGSAFTRAGTPEALNPAKLNVYRIRFGWLGSAPVRFEVLAPDGHWVTFHSILYPNLDTVPSIRDADLPVKLEIVKTAAGTGNLAIQTECWGAGVTTNALPVTEPLSVDPAPLATLTRSVITGEDSVAGGTLRNVKVTPAGAVTIAGTVDLGATDNAVLDAIAAATAAPNTAMQASTTSVLTSATELAATPLANRKRAIVQNLGGAVVYLGGSGVTVAAGLRLLVGASVTLDVGPDLNLYAIAESGSGTDVRVLELA